MSDAYANAIEVMLAHVPSDKPLARGAEPDVQCSCGQSFGWYSTWAQHFLDALLAATQDDGSPLVLLGPVRESWMWRYADEAHLWSWNVAKPSGVDGLVTVPLYRAPHQEDHDE